MPILSSARIEHPAVRPARLDAPLRRRVVRPRHEVGLLVRARLVRVSDAARLRRGREIIYEGKIATLKRFKNDANEVRAGLECGIKLDDFNGYQAADVIECYEIQKVRASL